MNRDVHRIVHHLAATVVDSLSLALNLFLGQVALLHENATDPGTWWRSVGLAAFAAALPSLQLFGVWLRKYYGVEALHDEEIIGGPDAPTS